MTRPSMNSVFIATSLDGYIADRSGGLDWLHAIPNPEGIDMGYGEFMSRMDAIVMGRRTFETVHGFDMDWPYHRHVHVLSGSMSSIPDELSNKVSLHNGPLEDVIKSIHKDGHFNLYIDGGTTIQGFLQRDLIDEMIITQIPIMLGGGTSLFGELTAPLNFRCTASTLFLDSIVQSRFVRERNTT